MLRACGADEKERMAGATHKLKGLVHMVVFPVGALKAKNARVSGESRFFKRPMERKKTEATDQRNVRSEQREINVSFLPGWASKMLTASILGVGLVPPGFPRGPPTFMCCYVMCMTVSIRALHSLYF